MADFTMPDLYHNGGEGWMRLVMFNRTTGVVNVKTINPSGELLEDSQHTFQLTGVSLGPPM